MELGFRDRFRGLWGKYFDGAELPITFYYTDQEGRGELVHATSSGHQCFLGVLGKVWKGQSLCFGATTQSWAKVNKRIKNKKI